MILFRYLFYTHFSPQPQEEKGTESQALIAVLGILQKEVGIFGFYIQVASVAFTHKNYKQLSQGV